VVLVLDRLARLPKQALGQSAGLFRSARSAADFRQVAAQPFGPPARPGRDPDWEPGYDEPSHLAWALPPRECQALEDLLALAEAHPETLRLPPTAWPDGARRDFERLSAGVAATPWEVTTNTCDGLEYSSLRSEYSKPEEDSSLRSWSSSNSTLRR
jgi:hypothetical protein